MQTRRVRCCAVALGFVIVTGVSAGVAETCPELLGRLPYGPAYAVSTHGGVAYVGSGATLLVVDVSDPATPSLLGEVWLADLVMRVVVAGSYAYVAGFDAGLRIVDVADLTAPVEVGHYDTPGSAYAVAVSGQNHELLFVAEGDAGLDVLTSCQAPLLHDGFESGGTSAWSFVAP